MKRYIGNVGPYQDLYRDDQNGIAWIEDHGTGLRISVHPNIDETGSVEGMKARGYWGKDDRVVLSHGFYYNIDRFVCNKDNPLERIVADECMCEACMERRANSGSKNSDYGNNSGDKNSGNHNSGNWNSGYCNSGDYNSGKCNSGNKNSGDCNSGNRNSGSRNSGDGNSGCRNSGDKNSGNHNSGNKNSGNCNSGDGNSGDWNKTNFSSGCFNTKEAKILMFNKPSDWTIRDWRNSDARILLNRIQKNVLRRVWSVDMTDQEKAKHPEYKTTGGYLKELDESECGQIWWNSLTGEERDIIRSIPNFDPEIFEECTGIKVHQSKR